MKKRVILFGGVLYMCYVCAMEEIKRSYKKESTKSSPSGIRFDMEQLAQIQKMITKLNTKQKVVDFLLNQWWWENKVDIIPNHKGLPPIRDIIEESKGLGVSKLPERIVVLKGPIEKKEWFEEPNKDKSYFDAPPEQKKKTVEDLYYEEIEAAMNPKECEEISKAAKTDPQLSDKAKARVIEASIQRSRQDDMN